MKAALSVLCLCLTVSAFAQPGETTELTDNVKLIRLSGKSYMHVSVSDIEGFGPVSSNGLIIIDGGEACLFDTPVTESQTKVLVDWIEGAMSAGVKAFVPNHWHEDCMGGIGYLHAKGIETYANRRTIKIAGKKGLEPPRNPFGKTFRLKAGETEAVCHYPGAAHSTDNIVVWIPSDKILFAGCMVKEASSTGLGNIVDGDAGKWPKTLDRVLRKFSEALVVIPGHGAAGGKEIIRHTKALYLKTLEK